MNVQCKCPVVRPGLKNKLEGMNLDFPKVLGLLTTSTTLFDDRNIVVKLVLAASPD